MSRNEIVGNVVVSKYSNMTSREIKKHNSPNYVRLIGEVSNGESTTIMYTGLSSFGVIDTLEDIAIYAVKIVSSNGFKFVR